MKQLLFFSIMTVLVAAALVWINQNIQPAAQRNVGESSSSMPEAADPVTVRFLTTEGGLSEPMVVPAVQRSDAEWKLRLTDEQYRVARAHGTERAFCGIFHDNPDKGVYSCVGCGLALFRSDAKFDSGTGWPSFFQPVAAENVSSQIDESYGMIREEVHCTRCKTHLGHVFPDGPQPKGKRFCINSAALSFRADLAPTTETVYFGAGCFWGIEAALGKVAGVLETEVGYAGGHKPNSTYQDVCHRNTGHAEVVKVVYDPAQISFADLLDTFWQIHNPTSVNRQGPDIGSQYRSALFFTTPGQEAVVRNSIAALTAKGRFAAPIATQVDVAGPYFKAEEYHQKYAEKNGGAACAFPGI